jgi:hypothetical protein
MKENINRRDFLKSIGAGGAYLIVRNIAPKGSVEQVLKVSQLSDTQASGKKMGYGY